MPSFLARDRPRRDCTANLIDLSSERKIEEARNPQITGIGWGGEVDRRNAYVLQGTPFNDGDHAVEAAKLALQFGADVNATNDAGDTALHGAASKGYDAIVQELADKGAQLEVKNRRGRTP
ncbi:MAG: ankyrin repeat domain-containing protein [Bryobacterales bacterium]|nr:ankyrin repeat domain-containing protein [Bryobacterales bacterium]